MPHTHHTRTSDDDLIWRRPRLSFRLQVGLGVLLVLAMMMGLAPASAQENIEDARQEREDAREAELRARAALDVLEAEWEDVQVAFDAADELVQLVESRAVAVHSQLQLAQLRLRQTQVAIDWAEYDRELVGDQLTDLAIQEYLGIRTEDSVFGSGDLNEALTRSTVLDVVQGAGYDVIDTARSAADRAEELRDQAETDVADVERLETALAEEQAELEAALVVRAKARDALDARLDEWEDVIAEWESIEQELTDFIRIEQQKLDINTALDAVRSADGYTWPTAGGIGSYFGYRTHPILGYSRLHGGIDIGGRMGQPIWAAKEGIVIMARVNGGYGNTIIVDHGNGYATLYGHQSSFEIKEGDYVETGQHIGNVGSTGLSTGPHLHFEVRLDGSVTDPLQFLPPR
jgi:murein DD-endopeptidase MepM/ murein hydrolase activator NlpD